MNRSNKLPQFPSRPPRVEERSHRGCATSHGFAGQRMAGTYIRQVLLRAPKIGHGGSQLSSQSHAGSLGDQRRCADRFLDKSGAISYPGCAVGPKKGADPSRFRGGRFADRVFRPGCMMGPAGSTNRSLTVSEYDFAGIELPGGKVFTLRMLDSGKFLFGIRSEVFIEGEDSFLPGERTSRGDILAMGMGLFTSSRTGQNHVFKGNTGVGPQGMR